MENTKHEDESTLSALKFICGKNEFICRLCLSPTENKYIDIESLVKLQTIYFENSVSYRSMLEMLNVPEEPFLPKIICNSCAKLTINTYLFQKLRQFSIEKWLKILKLLEESLVQFKSLKPDVQAAYVILNKTDNLLLTNHKRYNTKLKKEGVLKEVIRICQKYIQMQKKLKPCYCNICGKKLATRVSLVKHIKTHNKSFIPCQNCSKIFSTPSQLQEHSERVHYPKTIECDKCSNKFSTLKVLRAHVKTNHTPVMCKLCDMELPSRISLRTHLDQHQATSCPHCKKKFKNMSSYKVHLSRCGIKEEEQEKYVCDVCKKCYSRKNALRSHLKIFHGFGNVLSCKWCNKKFDAISRLNNHILKHTKEKNFKCDQCGNKFVSYPALVYHIRLHTGEKPFPCDLCGESFLSASRRMAHKKRKHIGPTKACTLCKMKFVTSHQLRKHFQRHFNPNSKLFITKDDLIALDRAEQQ